MIRHYDNSSVYRVYRVGGLIFVNEYEDGWAYFWS